MTAVKLHPGYAVQWGVVLTLVVTFELLRPWVPFWLWCALVAYIVALEGVALRRKGVGDTFTEWWAWLKSGGRDRYGIVAGFGLYFPLRLLSFPAIYDGTLSGFLAWAPSVALFGGLASWSVPHLLKGGRDG